MAFALGDIVKFKNDFDIYPHLKEYTMEIVKINHATEFIVDFGTPAPGLHSASMGDDKLHYLYVSSDWIEKISSEDFDISPDEVDVLLKS